MLQDSDYTWIPEVRRLVTQGRIRQAVDCLERIYLDRNQLELFRSPQELRSEANAVWLFKVRILQREGRIREALAWACLEHFLNPTNVTAQAVCNQLLSVLRQPPVQSSPAQPTPVQPDPWLDIAGMDQLKLMLEEEAILPVTQQELYSRYKIHAPNGILLFGPPGCGKTFFARKVAQRTGFSFVEVNPSDLASIYVHGTQTKIAGAFEEARRRSPAILFLDEVDAMIPKRDTDAGHHYSSETNEFLTQLNECHRVNVLVMAATNAPDRIDQAALRPGRFDRLVYVPPPDEISREALFRLYLKGRPTSESVEFGRLASETEGYSCADIEQAVNDAARSAMKGETSIATRHLFDALERNPPSIDSASLARYEQFRQMARG